MKSKFLRRDWNRYSKIGKKRKSKQKWKRPTGRDNKMREKRRGYPSKVNIGYKKTEKEKKTPKIIKNANELEKIKANEIILVGSVGKRKKIEIAQKAKEKKISFQNMNIEKFLKKNKIKKKKKSQEKKSETKKAKSGEKKR